MKNLITTKATSNLFALALSLLVVLAMFGMGYYYGYKNGADEREQQMWTTYSTQINTLTPFVEPLLANYCANHATSNLTCEDINYTCSGIEYGLNCKPNVPKYGELNIRR